MGGDGLELTWTISFGVAELRGESKFESAKKEIVIDPPSFDLEYKLPDEPDDAFRMLHGVTGTLFRDDPDDELDDEQEKYGPDLGNISISKETDLASPLLYQQCLEKDSAAMDGVVITGWAVLRAGASEPTSKTVPTYKMTLDGCRIASVSFNDMKETLKLKFKSIAWEFDASRLAGPPKMVRARWPPGGQLGD